MVFTDTADFTVRTLRDGILHFLMSFGSVAAAVRPVVHASGGEVVKIEGDSLLLGFDDAVAACEGVFAIEAAVRRYNRTRPGDERFRFSYGIGYGDLVEVDGDRFGLELNLASKLGEDLAQPGEALLTPSAAAALDRATLRRVAALPGDHLQEARQSPSSALSCAARRERAYLMASPASTRFRRSRSCASFQPRVRALPACSLKPAASFRPK